MSDTHGLHVIRAADRRHWRNSWLDSWQSFPATGNPGVGDARRSRLIPGGRRRSYAVDSSIIATSRRRTLPIALTGSSSTTMNRRGIL